MCVPDAGTDWIGGTLGYSSSATSISVGRQLTNWRLEDIYDESSTYNLESMDRPVLMNLWASWCGPCRFEFPYLTEFGQRDDLNFDLWFVNISDTNKSAAQRFLRDQDPNITALYDPNDAFSNQVGSRFLPTTILMDTDGTLLAAHVGIVTETVLEFFNAVSLAPQQGSFDNSTVVVDLVELLQPIDAETATPLTFGGQAAGSISDEDWREDYRFDGTAGQSVNLRLTFADDLEPYVVLISPSNELINFDPANSEADNAGSTLRFNLPETGTYVVIVSRFLEDEGFGEGNFNILLSDPNATEEDVVLLQYGAPTSGVLTYERNRDSFSIDVVTGEILTFTLTHEMPEEQLNLQVRLGSTRLVPYTRSENGELVTTVTVEESGRYSVYVARSSSSRAEPIVYNLLIESDGATAASPTPEDMTQAIAYGDSITDRLDNEIYEREYTFEGHAGDVIDIAATADFSSGNLDVSLTLLDSSAAVLV